MLKWVALILLIVLVVLGDCVNGQCDVLLIEYYKCKYSPDELSNKTFFNDQLDSIDTFEKAMDLFRSIYVELDWRVCQNRLCQCVRQNVQTVQMNYGPFFLNSNYYSDMLLILSRLRGKYTKAAFRPDETAPAYQYGFVLEKFCFNYGYSMASLKSYLETRACLDSFTTSSMICALTQMPLLNMASPNFTGQSPNVLTSFLKCTNAQLISCDVEIKRAVILNMLSYFPFVIQGRLLNFIDEIANSTGFMSSGNSTTNDNRTTVWVTGDPHIFSIQKGLETCNFLTQLVCVQTKTLQVNCTGAKVSNDLPVTMLSEIRIQFKIGKSSLSIYQADQQSFPQVFDNQNRKMTTADGKKWLEMSLKRSDLLTIIDYASNATIMIGKWDKFYFLMIRLSISSLRAGILYEGCPPALMNQPDQLGVMSTLRPLGMMSTPGPFGMMSTTLRGVRRKKRDTIDYQSVCSSSQSSNNSDISPDHLYACCVNDVSITGNVSFAQMIKSTSDASVELVSTDNSILNMTPKQPVANFLFQILAIVLILAANGLD